MDTENLNLILTALAAGVTASTEVAVRTSLEALRDALRRSFTGRPEALQKLDSDASDAVEWRELLGADLMESGAVNDPEVVTCARALCDVVAAHAAPVMNHVVQRDAYGTVGNIGAVGSLNLTNHFLSPQPPTAP